MAAGSDVILESCYEHVPYRLDSGHKLGVASSDEVSGNDTRSLPLAVGGELVETLHITMA